MRWRHLLLAPVVGSTFLTGCGSGADQFTVPGGQPIARSQNGEQPAQPKSRNNYLVDLPTQPGDATNGEVAVRIRATVNGVPIFEEEVQANAYQFLLAIQNLPEPNRSQKRREVIKETTDALIERELLIQDALARLKKGGPQIMAKLQEAADKEFDRRWVNSMKKGAGLKTDDELKDMLRRQGMSLDMIRRQWTRQFISSEYLRQRIMQTIEKIGREDLQEYYDTHPEEFKQDDAVEWLDLFIGSATGKYPTPDAARQMAEQIVGRAKQGEDFAAMCKQYDDGDSSLRNGAGIGKKRGEIRPVECEEPLFTMKAGDVGPIIETTNGYHVFKLMRRDFAGKKPFDDDAQKEIRNKLRSAMYERESKKIVEDLKRKAYIIYSR
jgi:hypothetical protein